MDDVLRKDAYVICPRKRHYIGTTMNDIPADKAILPGVIAFDPGQHRIAGEPYECRICGSKYVIDNCINTGQGWFPRAPKLEIVSSRKNR